MRLCLCRPTVSAGLCAYVDNLPVAQRPVDGRVGAGAATFSRPPVPTSAVVDTVAPRLLVFHYPPPDITMTTVLVSDHGRLWLISPVFFIFFFFSQVSSFPKQCQDGAHERIERCSQVNQQRGKAWQTPGLDQAVFQSHHQVLESHDEPR